MKAKTRFTHRKKVLSVSLSLIFGPAGCVVYAASTDIANAPMAVSNLVTPNVLVVYDNSQSMDAQMNGVMVSGDNPLTRGNTGRTVMRSAVTTYRTAFNWGLMTYGMTSNPPTLNSTYAYYLGSNTSMVFTNNCTGYVAGVFNGAPPTVGTSTAGGGLRCIANPQPLTGALAGTGPYITFEKSSDDFDVVDVLYYGSYSGAPAINQAWAPAHNTNNPTQYDWYLNHSTTVNTWNNSADFSSSWFSSTLTPTDAGYIPGNFGASPNNISRSLYIPRGWGYISNITGKGKLNEAVKVDGTTHYNNLQSLLANETSGATSEVKNGAVFTPLNGTLQDAKTYFATSLSGNTSPVGYTCQQNFVMLVTDGLPTGDTGGNLYSAAARTNTCNWSTTTNSCTTGAFGTAATDAITATNALRTTSVTGFSSTNKDGTGSVTGKYDIQTYVVALGDTVANPLAMSVMNAMAYNGGTDKAIPANNATAFQNAITAISDDITAKVGSSAAVAVANQNVTATDNASYTTSYNSGTWTGDVLANAIDVLTGIPSPTPLWGAGSAATQLDTRSSASRYIVTSTDTVGGIGGIQFQPTSAGTATKLSAAQQTLLNTPASTDGAAVLAYLRGDRSGEPVTYRPRAHLLGDTINAEPVLVREPSQSYTDTGYAAFKTANALRTRVLFQGANDGMLHALVASTGAESWAYIPNLLMGSLNNLSSKSGFSHKYYVDGTPATADVDFNNIHGISTGGDWRSILVGGLAKGGRGYYALDVTNPAATSEVDAKSKVLWEFPNSVQDSTARNSATLNTGYSFEKPVIVKTQAEGWVVLVTSGYNNGTNAGDSGGDGLGHVFVLNPKTGDLIKDIPTTGCNATATTNPCGLAQITPYINAFGIVENLYGGDLKGNVWRFDLTGASSTAWSATKFAQLADGSGVAQPITTAPVLSNNATGDRLVVVGTGEYLGVSDVSTTQVQTIYALKDTPLSTLPTPLRSSLQMESLSAAPTPVNYTTQKGWYIDLSMASPSLTGARVNVQPTKSIGGRILVNANIPSSVPCSPGGSSYHFSTNPDSAQTDNRSFGSVLSSSPVPYLSNGKSYSITHTSGDPSAGGATPPPCCSFGPNNTVICLEDVDIATCLPLTPSPAAQPKRTWRQLFLYQ